MTRAAHSPGDPAGRARAAARRAAPVAIELKLCRGSAMPNRTGPARILVVTGDPDFAGRALRAIDGRATCLLARDSIEALALMICRDRGRELRLDGALIDADACRGESLELAAELAKRGTGVVLAADADSAPSGPMAHALGCREVIARNLRVLELSRLLLAAAGLGAHRTRRPRGGRRLRRLDGLCRREERAAHRAARENAPESTDQVGGNMECAAAMNQVTTATEFKTLIKHELDIEQLLRTTLEFVLARSGPTNAAVFLPTTSGDYSLGAYVNYDCPKETVDMLLDHIANTVAPKFEKTQAIVQLGDARKLEEFAGGDSAWLGESGVIGFACRHDGEVLAIVMLFRDRLSPFGPLLIDQLRTIGELFASQLARVIHVHHRHLPKEKWGCIGDPPECDDEDLAA